MRKTGESTMFCFKSVFFAAAITALLVVGQVAQADLLTPTSVTASSYINLNKAEKLIDGSGMNGSDLTALHDNNAAGSSFWITTKSPVADAWLVFDLGDVYDLTDAHIWQYNQVATNYTLPLPGRCVADLDIAVSTDGGSYTTIVTDATLDSGTFPTGSYQYSEPAQTIALIASNVRYVKFLNMSAQSGATSEYLGLSEVRFSGETVPEPSTILLMTMAGISGLLLCAWRRRK